MSDLRIFLHLDLICRECGQTKQAYGNFANTQIKAAIQAVNFDRAQLHKIEHELKYQESSSEGPVIEFSASQCDSWHWCLAISCLASMNHFASRVELQAHTEKVHTLNKERQSYLIEERSAVCVVCAGSKVQRETVRPLPVAVHPLSGLPRNDADQKSSEASTKSSSSYVYTTKPMLLSHMGDGLRYYQNMLSEAEAQRVMAIVDATPWIKLFRRRQQFFGQVYYHTRQDNSKAQPLISNAENGANSLDPFDFLIDKFYQPPFDKNPVFGTDRSQFPIQILVNEYLENFGISSHFEDEAAFGSVIATVSLLQPIFMTLEHPVAHTNDCQEMTSLAFPTGTGHMTEMHRAQTKILLEENSMLILSGPARFQWRHGITRHNKVFLPNHPPFYSPSKTPDVERKLGYRRVSLTIRHLLNGRKQVD